MGSKLREWFNNNYRTIIRFTFIIPILFVAGVSITHVITWYEMTNPSIWAKYLSVGVEIAALSALAGMVTKGNKAVYLPFGIVTLIQFVGNTFFAFQFIDINSTLFKDWVLLVDPLFDIISINDLGDITGHRRILAILGGALLPLISLSFLHLLVKYNDKIDINIINNLDPIEPNKEVIIDEPIIEDKSEPIIEVKVVETPTEPIIEDLKEDIIIEEKSIDNIEPESMVINETTPEVIEPIIVSEVIPEEVEVLPEPIITPPVKKKGIKLEDIPGVNNNTIERVGTNKVSMDGNRFLYKKNK